MPKPAKIGSQNELAVGAQSIALRDAQTFRRSDAPRSDECDHLQL